MSDLAPFVAAVLRDKTIAALQQELETEKAKVQRLQEELRVIRVTGPGGFPVYAERHFQYAEQVPDENLYNVMLHNSTFAANCHGAPPANPNLPTCPIEDVHKCELHIGGKEILVLGDYEQGEAASAMGAPECKLIYTFHQEPEDGDQQIYICIEFGPNPDPNATELGDPSDYQNEDIDYVCFYLVMFWKHPFDANPS